MRTDGPARRCPECGLPAGPLPRWPRWSRRARLAPWAVALAGLLLVIVMTLRTMPAPYTAQWPGGIMSPLWLLDQRLTRDGLKDLAARPSADGRLRIALAELASRPADPAAADPDVLVVQFAGARGARSVWRHQGWPLKALSTSTNTGYDDVFARSGPALTDSYEAPEDYLGVWHLSWRYLVAERWDIRDGSTWVIRRLSLSALAADAAFVAMLWLVVRSLCRCVAPRAARGRRAPRRACAAALLAAALVAAGWWAFGDRSVERLSPSMYSREVQEPVRGLPRSAVSELAATPGGESELARRILGVSDGRGDAVLAAGFTQHAAVTLSQGGGGWPIGLFRILSYEHHPQEPDGSRAALLAPMNTWVDLREAELWLALGARRGATQRALVAVDLGALAVLGLGLWAAAAVAGLVLRRVERRGLRRRERLGQCLGCGYPLGQS